jgi:hypothetical protein
VIDFRYHLVSIIAVFLALAVGLLVGATALSGPVENLLHHELNVVGGKNSALTKDKQALTQQVNADQAFAQAGSQRLLGGILAGEKVVVVVSPGAGSAVTTSVTTALHQAGATVTGVINLKQGFLDTTGQTESTLTQLAQRLAPAAGVTPPATPVNSAVAGQQAAAAVLSAAILSKGAGLSAAATQSVLSGFGQGGFLSVSGPNGSTSVAQAALAVLIVPAGQPLPGSTSAAAGQVMPVVAQELKAAGAGTVMAGPVSAIGDGSAISAEDTTLQVSTVDNADTQSGAIMVAQALNFLLHGKAPAQFGITPATAPSPAPTPSPTSAASKSAAHPKPSSTASTGG